MNQKLTIVSTGIVGCSASRFCIGFLTLALAAGSGCTHPRAWQSAERPLVVSHRGGRAEYDDNAAGGFARGLKQGIRGYETDVRMTKDDRLVIMHDGDVARTTTATGRISALTRAQVTSLTLRKSGERVPALEDVVGVFRGKEGIRVEFEMKENTRALGAERARRYCEMLYDTVTAAMLPGTYVFTSFSTDTLATMRAVRPDAPTGLITGKPCTRELVDEAVRLGCEGVAPGVTGTTREAVDYAHEKGIFVSLWMVQDLKTYRLVSDLGADTCTSDRPFGLLSEVRESCGKQP